MKAYPSTSSSADPSILDGDSVVSSPTPTLCHRRCVSVADQADAELRALVDPNVGRTNEIKCLLSPRSPVYMGPHGPSRYSTVSTCMPFPANLTFAALDSPLSAPSNLNMLFYPLSSTFGEQI